MNIDINKNIIFIFSSLSLLHETFKCLSYIFLNIKKEIKDNILKFDKSFLLYLTLFDNSLINAIYFEEVLELNFKAQLNIL